MLGLRFYLPSTTTLNDGFCFLLDLKNEIYYLKSEQEIKFDFFNVNSSKLHHSRKFMALSLSDFLHNQKMKVYACKVHNGENNKENVIVPGKGYNMWPFSSIYNIIPGHYPTFQPSD